MKSHRILCAIFLFAVACALSSQDVSAQQKRKGRQPSPEQLKRWLKQFPKADTNKDGVLTIAEATAFRQQMQNNAKRSGPPSSFPVDPGWKKDGFPEQAVSLRTPKEIRELWEKVKGRNDPGVKSYERPADGSLRIVATGHSFMAPGFSTFPKIANSAGLDQPPVLKHVGGGMTGSSRYKWEEENGIFQFNGRPRPLLLASIANAEWDAMMWGPYYQDEPRYYSCWVDFCLKYNPEMKFYLSDAWPQLEQFEEAPKSEDEITYEALRSLGNTKNRRFGHVIESLQKDYPGKAFIMPTSDAMILAVREYHNGNLPGIEGIHKVIGGKDRSLWKDRLGHLGPGLEYLEGYVFFATIYRKSPELIEESLRPDSPDAFPNAELDRVFRKIAWEAVINNKWSGVTDKDGDGLGD